MRNKGQVALEYLLIFTISLIILLIFTLPLTQQSIENTLDISNTLNTKSDLSKIAQTIKQVHGEGQGSKQKINIQSDKNIELTIANNYISTNLNLTGTNKQIKINYKSNLDKTNIQLSKGENILTVEWPINNEKMIIYKNQ
ncbi:MAG: class III signal peptide-containing protein [Methanobrevibacter thaueri]|nr:class III signal peptide-containing protein [Methanobrevibacter thaueri]